MIAILGVLAFISVGEAALPKPKKKTGTEIWWSLKPVVRPDVPQVIAAAPRPSGPDWDSTFAGGAGSVSGG
jgi:hypothetical protein